MLFARNPLASGPQACFLAKKVTVKVKVGKIQIPLDPPTPFFYTDFTLLG
jgi:hypothetical protein